MKRETRDEDDFEIIHSEEQDEYEDTASYEIISYGADYTISVYYNKIKSQEIILPSFQRRYVWSIEQASRLVESFLLGLPVPGIFLAKDKISGNLIVIDGQQRLATCESFKDGVFPNTKDSFVLMGVKAQWSGKTYSELDPVDRKRFDDSVLRATIIQQIRPKDQTSVYHIFQRLNTGGTPLSNQEIRNCLYQGTFNNLLDELNNHPIWRKLYRSKEFHKRKRDEELILRFFALYYDYANYKKPMNEFLSTFMEDHQNPKSEDLQNMKEIFIDTISLVNDKIGPRAFRPKGNINTAAFDSIVYIIATNKKSLKNNLDQCVDALFKDKDYIKAINQATTDPETIKLRFDTVRKFFVK
jgi:uncharacterized protein with ParB-like and HNH nuclease domain